MYGSTTVLGQTLQQLPFTGMSAVGYVLLGLALLVSGLLLARVGRAQPVAGSVGGAGRLARAGRIGAALAVAVLGLALLVFAGDWRGLETWVAAGTIHLATSQPTVGVVNADIVVLGRHSGPAWMFALTDECSVAQLLGAMLIGGAPLLLVRRLSVLRIASALSLASLVLVAVNVFRLTTIGVAVNTWGSGGFAFAHTYLGSLVTFAGTCAAGVVFAVVLIAHRRVPAQQPDAGPET